MTALVGSSRSGFPIRIGSGRSGFQGAMRTAQRLKASLDQADRMLGWEQEHKARILRFLGTCGITPGEEPAP